MIKKRSRGRRLLLAVPLALLLGLVAAGSAWASTTNVPIWQSGGSAIPFGTSRSLSGGQSIAGLTLNWENSGEFYYLSCEGLKTTGSVENFASGKSGTYSNTVSAFNTCWVWTEETYETCALSHAPTLQGATGELSDEGSSAVLNVKGTIAINLAGCGNTTWSTQFSGTLVPGWQEGEFWVSKAIPVTLNGGSAHGELAGLGLKMQSGTTPISVAQEAVENGPFTGTHWYSGGASRNRGEKARALLAAGHAVSLFKGSTSLAVESVIGGVTVKLACTGMGSVGGSVENPTGGGKGTAQLAFEFSGCEVVTPVGGVCTVLGGGFTTGSLSGTQIEEVGGPLLQLEPVGTTTIAKVEIEGSGCPSALRGSLSLTGKLMAKPQMEAGAKRGSWLLPSAKNKTSVSGLKFRGQTASASGEITAETLEHEIVTLG
jgi:hypothetical protein